MAKLLIERDGIDPEMAKFASSAAQGHVGRAKYLATNKEARENREKILNLPSTVIDLASAFEAANTLLEMAKEQAKAGSEILNEQELTKLKESYGTNGSRLAAGGSKAIKELESNIKRKYAKINRDFIYQALVELQNSYLTEARKNSIEMPANLTRAIFIEDILEGINSNFFNILKTESIFSQFYLENKNQKELKND